MTQVLRSAAALLLGLVVGVFVIGGLEIVAQVVHPFPHGIHEDDPEAVNDAIENAPLEAFLPILIAWAVGTFIGAFVAARFAGTAPVLHGLIVGAMFFSAAVTVMLHHPHPLWVVIVGLAMFFPVAFFAGNCARRSLGSGK